MKNSAERNVSGGSEETRVQLEKGCRAIRSAVKHSISLKIMAAVAG